MRHLVQGSAGGIQDDNEEDEEDIDEDDEDDQVIRMFGSLSYNYCVC